jgi:PncC family amidohydrolase
MSQLEEQIVKLCKQRNYKISTAESVTGGLIASIIINVPGASEVINEAYITYSDDSKVKNLSINPALFLSHDIVSERIALEMVKGLRKKTYAEVCIATTGYAGPKSSKGVPVGTVCIGISIEDKVYTAVRLFVGSRNEIRQAAAQFALEETLKYLKG